MGATGGPDEPPSSTTTSQPAAAQRVEVVVPAHDVPASTSSTATSAPRPVGPTEARGPGGLLPGTGAGGLTLVLLVIGIALVLVGSVVRRAARSFNSRSPR